MQACVIVCNIVLFLLLICHNFLSVSLLTHLHVSIYKYTWSVCSHTFDNKVDNLGIK